MAHWHFCRESVQHAIEDVSRAFLKIIRNLRSICKSIASRLYTYSKGGTRKYTITNGIQNGCDGLQGWNDHYRS